MTDQFQTVVLVKPSGEVVPHNAEAWRMFLAEHAGGPYTLTLRRPHRPRTLDQNAYFHGPLLRAVMEAGNNWNEEQAKEGIKRKYRIESTAALSREAMTDLIEQVIADGLNGDFGDGFVAPEE